MFRTIYLYNPISVFFIFNLYKICAICVHWTNIFDASFGLLSIYLLIEN